MNKRLPAGFATGATATTETTTATGIATTAEAAGTGATASAAAEAAAATSALRTGTGDIDVQGTAIQISAVQSGDGVISLLIVGHFDEAEAPRTASVTVGQNAYTVHGSERFERIAEIVFSDAERKVANKDILQGKVLLDQYRAIDCWRISGSRQDGQVRTGSLSGEADIQMLVQHITECVKQATNRKPEFNLHSGSGRERGGSGPAHHAKCLSV